MHAIEIIDDLLVVLDEDGHGVDAHELRNYPDAQRQVEAWASEYAIDAADVDSQLMAYFLACRDEEMLE
jgi:hypothetical protein